MELYRSIFLLNRQRSPRVRRYFDYWMFEGWAQVICKGVDQTSAKNTAEVILSEYGIKADEFFECSTVDDIIDTGFDDDEGACPPEQMYEVLEIGLENLNKLNESVIVIQYDDTENYLLFNEVVSEIEEE